MEKSVHVTLTGGLGNQLFQLAAGLSVFDERPINLMLDSGLGRPRRNEDGLPEIASFEFADSLVYSNITKNPWFSRKVNGYLLRMGINYKWYERAPWVRLVITSIGKFVLRNYYKENVEIICGSGLGYSKIENSEKSCSLNGYFQSYRYLENGIARSVLESMRVKVQSEELNKYKQLASVERPLVVHFRFGDYENEPLFGIPSSQYYIDSIEQAIRELDVDNIWVFSDDLNKAKAKIPHDLGASIRWINSIGNSTSQTLELMTYGSHYVIANSSFSYWSAILSKNKDARVWAPWPWFEKMPSPQDLIPPHWVTINPWDSKNS